MTSRVLLLLLSLWIVTPAFGQVGIGDRREDVLRVLGKPTSVAKRGDNEILLYPNGGRVVLIDGRVSSTQGTLTAVAAPPPEAPQEAPPTAPAAAPELPPIAEKPAAPPPARTAPPPDFASEPEEFEDPAPSLGVAIALLGIVLVVQFGLTLAALKIAFHYQQMDALWSGILAITGIDVALQLVMAVIRYFAAGELELGIGGTGLPGLVMIWSIHYFCLDQRWSRAVATTAGVKLVGILLNLFLEAALLQLLT